MNIKGVTDTHFRWVGLYLQAFDLVLTHDLRPRTGILANQTTFDARREAAIMILQEAFSVGIDVVGKGAYAADMFAGDKTGACSEIEEKIISFSNLPEGWDYGNGGPISDRITSLRRRRETDRNQRRSKRILKKGRQQSAFDLAQAARIAYITLQAGLPAVAGL